MSDNKFMYPKAGAIRQPTSNAKQNGRIVNPPRMAELGGLSSTGKANMGNNLSIKKPAV